MMNATTINSQSSAVLLKRALLFFWAAWLSVVLFSNVADAARSAGVLAESWVFASGNFRFIQQTTAKFGTPHVVNAGLFSAVIVWEAIAAVLFWRATWTYRGQAFDRIPLHYAFMVSLGLWGAFVIADEICLAYALESVHLRLLIAQLATLLTIELLPEHPPSRHSAESSDIGSAPPKSSHQP